MINSKIIKIASLAKNNELKNKYTHKSSVKNSLCGDIIKTEFIADKFKVKSMRYETESCILCEASASLLSKKMKNNKIRNMTIEIKKIIKMKNKVFPKKFKEFNQLINQNNISRVNCVILPMEAFLKAFKFN